MSRKKSFLISILFLALPALSSGQPQGQSQATQGRNQLFMKLQEVIGMPIADNAGNQGVVEDFVVTQGGDLLADGSLTHVAVNFPQAGTGRTYLVPMSSLEVLPGKITLTLDQTDLRSMPTLQEGRLPPEMTTADSSFLLASKIGGLAVVGPGGDEIGQVAGIMLNLPDKVIDYLAVAPSGVPGASAGLYAVPPGDVAQADPARNQVQLIVGEELFKQLKAFRQDDWPQSAGLVGTISPGGIYPVATEEQLLNALSLSMSEEASANRLYLAYADMALDQGNEPAALVWNTVALVELEDHFESDGKMAGIIQSDPIANLQTATDTEQQTLSRFKKFAQDASAEGNAQVADALQNLIRIEQNHLDLLQQALEAVKTGTAGKVPTGPSLSEFEAVAITAGPPAAEGKVLGDVEKAFEISSYQTALFDFYSREAISRGNLRLGQLYANISQIEYQHVSPTLASLGGVVSPSLAENLADSLGVEREANNRYVSQAQLAETLGEKVISRKLWSNGMDESGHGDCFQTLLDSLGSSPATGTQE